MRRLGITRWPGGEARELEPVQNLRSVLTCANCIHRNHLLRHSELSQPYAIKCARPNGPEFDIEHWYDADLICDGFEERE